MTYSLIIIGWPIWQTQERSSVAFKWIALLFGWKNTMNLCCLVQPQLILNVWSNCSSTVFWEVCRLSQHLYSVFTLLEWSPIPLPSNTTEPLCIRQEGVKINTFYGYFLRFHTASVDHSVDPCIRSFWSVLDSVEKETIKTCKEIQPKEPHKRCIGLTFLSLI